ncbi:MAG: tRNA lysidine(34) synthetase TilS [Planctomycetota bacterium]
MTYPNAGAEKNGSLTIAEFESRLAGEWLGSSFSGVKSLIAVSGGADSVALACGLSRIVGNSKQLILAHYNHGWRGEESDGDAEFVEALAGKLGLAYRVGGLDSRQSNESQVWRSEEAARDLRYEFLVQCAYQIGARSIATAHHGSDRVETSLHNLFRGTGVSGMRSIQKLRPIDEELILVRPILGFSRQQILDYLRALGQEYRTDVTNEDDQFKRNFLRLEILPKLRERYGPSVDQHLIGFADIAEDLDQMLAELAGKYLVDCDAHYAKFHDKQFPEAYFSIPSARNLPVHWPVLHKALQIKWAEFDWPLGSMHSAHWIQFRKAHRDCTKEDSGFVSNLPLNLLLRMDQGWLHICPQSAGGSNMN